MTVPYVTVFPYADQWAIIGEQSSASLLVCGGPSPTVIKVSADDAAELQRLVQCANIMPDLIRALNACRVELSGKHGRTPENCGALGLALTILETAERLRLTVKP